MIQNMTFEGVFEEDRIDLSRLITTNKVEIVLRSIDISTTRSLDNFFSILQTL